jgi:hypothetical protein
MGKNKKWIYEQINTVAEIVSDAMADWDQNTKRRVWKQAKITVENLCPQCIEALAIDALAHNLGELNDFLAEEEGICAYCQVVKAEEATAEVYGELCNIIDKSMGEISGCKIPDEIPSTSPQARACVNRILDYLNSLPSEDLHTALGMS